ncbi:hypothetical protein [Shouchella rhizosphaerae]|uniref:Uncharacterized protein n=1 Tax=Shouchella rhizosphaerae TaxID=866786 RepID=A0ABZ2CY72_9BACI|nr:hypothetical protein J26TS2_00080 [Shouchella clausii]
MLTKFPVTTDRGEYRVDVCSHYRHRLIPNWTVLIYKPRIKPSLFRKFDLLYEFDTTVSAYERYSGNLIELATDAVKMYEEAIEERDRIELAREEAIEAFHAWDGDMTTKEESR